MFRIFAVALLAVGMSVGLAQAKGHKQRIAACGEGQQARHAPVVSEPAVDHCCARRGNGAMAG